MVTLPFVAWSAIWNSACLPTPLLISEQMLQDLERATEPQLVRVFDGGGEIDLIYVPTIHDDTFVATLEGSLEAARGVRIASDIMRVGDYILATVSSERAVFGFEGWARAVDIRRDLPAMLAYYRGDGGKTVSGTAGNLLLQLDVDSTVSSARAPSLHRFLNVAASIQRSVDRGTSSPREVYPYLDAELRFIARTSMSVVGVEDSSAACRQGAALAARAERLGYTVKPNDILVSPDTTAKMRAFIRWYEHECVACRDAERYDAYACALLRHPIVTSVVMGHRAALEEAAVVMHCPDGAWDPSDTTFEHDRVRAAVESVITAAEKRGARYAVLFFGYGHTSSVFIDAIEHGIPLSIACVKETCSPAVEIFRRAIPR